MVLRAKDLTDRDFARWIETAPLPTFESTPWTDAKRIDESRIAIVTTAGVAVRGDRPFGPGDGGYRVLPGDVAAADLVMSHVSVNFDRTGFRDDPNVAFPIDRLREMASTGEVGELADFHYAFMGATDPGAMQDAAGQVAGLLRKDRVDAVLLTPV
jgi:D-proline reductase (dithiol) PrdB